MSSFTMSAKPTLSARSSLSASLNTRSLRKARAQPVSNRQLRVEAGVEVGDKAPDFTLPDQNGKDVKLSKFQGIFGKPVVLYFYGADGSPSCTKQAQAFTDSYAEFKKAGAVVLGVSSDSQETHAEFIDELGLPFTLLSDEGDAVREAYGIPKDFLGLLKGRQTYVINKKGVVEFVFNNQFSPEKHIDQTLGVLQGTFVN